LSGRGLCDEPITRPEESYRLCCVVVCDLETSRMGALIYIYDISRLRVKQSAFTAVSYEYTTNLDSNLGGWIYGLLLFIYVWPANQLPNEPVNRPSITSEALYHKTFRRPLKVKVKVKQSHYMPGKALRVPGS